MKKTAFTIVVFCCTSLFAAASQRESNPGDPPGNKQQQPTFTLSSGYFSFFGLFSAPMTSSDTTIKIVTPVQPSSISKMNAKPKS